MSTYNKNNINNGNNTEFEGHNTCDNHSQHRDIGGPYAIIYDNLTFMHIVFFEYGIL